MQESWSMSPHDFHIGMEFTASGRRYRCTDIGSRTVIAIRVDEVTAETFSNRNRSSRRLTQAEAEADGWFNGPPYGVAEIVFDEDDLETCEPCPANNAGAGS